jgi:hypothetical protein
MLYFYCFNDSINSAIMYQTKSIDEGVGLLIKGKTDFEISGMIPELQGIGLFDYSPGGLSVLQ